MTITPTPAAPSLLPGEDTGVSDSDGVTNFNGLTPMSPTLPSPVFNGLMLVGQTLPNAVIALYDNAVAAGAGNTTADANGFYSIYPYPVLDDGKHSLTITATAPGQATSLYSPPLAIVIDTSAPDAPTAPVLAAGSDTGVSAEDGITDNNILQLTGTTEPGAVVALYNGTTPTTTARMTPAAGSSFRCSRSPPGQTAATASPRARSPTQPTPSPSRRWTSPATSANAPPPPASPSTRWPPTRRRPPRCRPAPTPAGHIATD